MNILVTGSNGYIGAHLCKVLHECGHRILAIDNTLYDRNDVTDYVDSYFGFDIRSTDLQSESNFIITLRNWIRDQPLHAVVHLAGAISVEESTRLPSHYYSTNTFGTMNLIKLVQRATSNCAVQPHFIFASTAAAFDPISPYAISKIAAEDIIKEQMKDHYTIFRFFNVAGSNGIHRQIGSATHLIRIAAECAAGLRPQLTINGDTFDTFDGTCVRDYVHVVDLVSAISYAIDAGPQNTPYECLGNGTGYSNKQVIDVMKRVSGVDFNVNIGPARTGDAATLLVQHPSKLLKSVYTLEDMCRSAFEMTKKL